jgi:hypothetical protein
MYGKIFEEIFDGTLMAHGGPMATYTFISMIILADQHGIVNMTAEALGKRIGLPGGVGSFLEWEEFRRGLDLLAEEDAESNLPNEDGKRIIPMKEITNGEENRGWLIVNYDFYRKKASKSDTKEKTRDRVRRFRERECNASVTDGNGCEGHTDTDTDTDKKNIQKRPFSFLRKTTIPKNIFLTEDMIHYTKCKRWTIKPEDGFEAFVTHHKAKGTLFNDWHSAFQKWVQNDIKWHPENQECETELV